MRRIVIIGLGALGSQAAILARNWETLFRIVDFDRVEAKNTMAQAHSKMFTGRNKAQAIQQTLQGMWGLRMDAVPHKLTADNVDMLLGDASLVLDCTDNGEARRLIQGYVRDHGIPCLHGALSADGFLGRAVWDEHFKIDDEGEEGQATCEDGEQLPMFALTAAQITVTAQRFLDTGDRRSYQITPSGIIRLA